MGGERGGSAGFCLKGMVGVVAGGEKGMDDDIYFCNRKKKNTGSVGGAGGRKISHRSIGDKVGVRMLYLAPITWDRGSKRSLLAYDRQPWCICLSARTFVQDSLAFISGGAAGRSGRKPW